MAINNERIKDDNWPSPVEKSSIQRGPRIEF